MLIYINTHWRYLLPTLLGRVFCALFWNLRAKAVTHTVAIETHHWQYQGSRVEPEFVATSADAKVFGSRHKQHFWPFRAANMSCQSFHRYLKPPAAWMRCQTALCQLPPFEPVSGPKKMLRDKKKSRAFILMGISYAAVPSFCAP